MANEDNTMGPLFEALARAQAKIKGAEKDGTNPHFHSKYATLASVWEACREALTSEGLAVAQTFDMDGGVAIMVTILGHKSGAMLTSRYPLNPVKADPQGMAAAATYARRVGLAAIAGVAPEDDDGETAAGRGETRAVAKKEAPATVTASRPPADPLTNDDITMLYEAGTAAGLKRDDWVAVLLEHGGGASGMRAVDRSFLAGLMAHVKSLAEPKAPTADEIGSDVDDVFGPETK